MGWFRTVIDHAANTEPRGSVVGLQLLQAGMLASASNAAIEQRGFEVMTHYLVGVS
jgi:hypothetical protein